jgi:hypothetical protein
MRVILTTWQVFTSVITPKNRPWTDLASAWLSWSGTLSALHTVRQARARASESVLPRPETARTQYVHCADGHAHLVNLD